jgi:plastocyanin
LNRTVRRPSLRAALGVALAALTTLALAACGDEEEQALTYSLTTQGKESVVSGPGTADAGLAEITLDNEADREAELQLIRVEGDHSAQEVIDALGGVVEGKPFPDWFFAGGGVGTTKAGQSQTVTQVLMPGTYYAVDLEGEGPPKAENVPAIEVSGEESGGEVEADATVTAIEYGFESEQLPSGEVEIDFENAGNQPHHMIASKITGDAGAEEVEEFYKTEKGEPPLQDKGTQSTAVLEGGEAQAVTFDLEPGRYAFYCFIADREGGPPHALKGMVDEVEVQ